MRRIAFLAAGLLASQPALAQQGGTMTLVIAPLTQQLEGLDSATLAVEVRQRLDRGALSGVSIPMVQDGRRHQKTVRLGGDPAVFVDRGLSVTTVQAAQRDIVLSYGPARRGGIGVHAEVVDSALTPSIDGTVRTDEGGRGEITGVLPADGRPQAVMTGARAAPGSIVLPESLIVLVEP